MHKSSFFHVLSNVVVIFYFSHDCFVFPLLSFIQLASDVAIIQISLIGSTVVPAFGDPFVSGHLSCTDTLSMSRHISTLNYLRSATTCLTRTRTVICWLSAPGITDSANKCRVSVVVSTKNRWLAPKLRPIVRSNCRALVW